MAFRCGFTNYTISRKKSLLNVKFSLKIQVSIHAGSFTSFLPLTSKLKCQLKLYLQSLTLEFPMALSK